METAINPKQDQAVESLSHCCRYTKNLELIPDLVVEVIENNWWQVRRPSKMMGKEFAYSTFQEFVEDHPPQGLGIQFDTLKKLCRDKDEALVAIRDVSTKPNHRPVGSSNNITTSRDTGPAVRGTYKDYTLYRLKKDHPALYQRVLSKELTANKAAIEAGFRKRMVSVEHSVDGFIKAITKKFSKAEVEEIASALS